MDKQFSYWNDGDPLQAEIKGQGNKRSLELASGASRQGKITADPDIDLYEQVFEGLEPNQYQMALPETYSKTGLIITTTRAVSYLGIAEIQALKIDEAKAAEVSILSKDVWQVIRELEEPGRPMAQPIKQWRKDIRQQSDDFEAAVNLETDPATCAGMQPVWPVDPRG